MWPGYDRRKEQFSSTDCDAILNYFGFRPDTKCQKSVNVGMFVELKIRNSFVSFVIHVRG